MAVTMKITEKALNAKVARMRPIRGELKKAADKLAVKASAKLAEHHHSGDAQITVTRGRRVDYFVNLDDSRGQHAAAAIEFGHVTESGRFVDGIHALTGSLR